MNTPEERANELIFTCVFGAFVLVTGSWAIDYDRREEHCQSLHESGQFHAVPFSSVRMCYFKPNKETENGKTKAPR